jgi:hypothetical protein
MDVALAKSILLAAKEGGFYEQDLPDGDELFEDAKYFLTESRLAWDQEWGKDNETVWLILDLAKNEPNGSGNETLNIRKEEPLSNDESSEQITVRRDASQKRESVKALPLSYQLAEEENFPIPPDIEGTAPDMPRDLTALSDLKIRKLYGDFNAFMARAKWLLAVQSSDLANATHMREKAYREAYTSLDRIDDQTEKPKSIPVLEIETKRSPEYSEWNDKVNKHNMIAITYKALVDIYENNIDRLSREMTFRDQEWQRNK